MPADPTGRLFGRGLDEIADLYIEPVSSRILALAAAARLSRARSQIRRAGDARDRATTPRSRSTTAAASSRPIRTRRATTRICWGAWLGQRDRERQGRLADPRATSEDKIDKALFDGMTGGARPLLALLRAAGRARSARRARRLRRGRRDARHDRRPRSGSPRSCRAGPPIAPASASATGSSRSTARPTAGRSQSEVVRELRGPVLSTGRARHRAPGHRRQPRLPAAAHADRRADGDRVARRRHRRVSYLRLQPEHDPAARRRSRRGPAQMGPQLRGIVLDLRGDPGGLLDQAVEPRRSCSSPRGRSSRRSGAIRRAASISRPRATASRRRCRSSVLVNGGSASASEIVAAALQDAGRAVVVGTASYGKGTVQTVLRLPNDGELTLTWAELVAPVRLSAERARRGADGVHQRSRRRRAARSRPPCSGPVGAAARSP